MTVPGASHPLQYLVFLARFLLFVVCFCMVLFQFCHSNKCVWYLIWSNSKLNIRNISFKLSFMGINLPIVLSIYSSNECMICSNILFQSLHWWFVSSPISYLSFLPEYYQVMFFFKEPTFYFIDFLYFFFCF